MDPQSNQQVDTNLSESISPVASVAGDDSDFEQSFEINHSPNTSIPSIAQIPLAPATSLPHEMTTSTQGEMSLHDKVLVEGETPQPHKDVSGDGSIGVVDSFEAVQPNLGVINDATNSGLEWTDNKPTGLPATPIVGEFSSQLTPADMTSARLVEANPVMNTPIQLQDNINTAQALIDPQLGEGLGGDINNYFQGIRDNNLTESNLGETIIPGATAYQQGTENSPILQVLPTEEPSLVSADPRYFNDSGSVSGVSESMSMTNLPVVDQDINLASTVQPIDDVATSVGVASLPTNDNKQDNAPISALSNTSETSDDVGTRSIPNIAPIINPNDEPVDLFESTGFDSLQPPPPNTANITTQVTDNLDTSLEPLQFIKPSVSATSLNLATLPPSGYSNAPPSTPAPLAESVQYSAPATMSTNMPNPKPKILSVRNILIVSIAIITLVAISLVAKSMFFNNTSNTEQNPTNSETVDADKQDTQQDDNPNPTKVEKPVKDIKSTQPTKPTK